MDNFITPRLRFGKIGTDLGEEQWPWWPVLHVSLIVALAQVFIPTIGRERKCWRLHRTLRGNVMWSQSSWQNRTKRHKGALLWAGILDRCGVNLVVIVREQVGYEGRLVVARAADGTEHSEQNRDNRLAEKSWKWNRRFESWWTYCLHRRF